MLFWLFVIALVVGVICVVVGWLMYKYTRFNTEWLEVIGIIIAAVAAIAIIASGIFMFDTYGNIEAKIALNNETYKSLTYQLENNLYDNDNDLGKKELYNEIREWNEDLAYYQNAQDDFWLGIFYPDVFDQFEFIKYE